MCAAIYWLNHQMKFRVAGDMRPPRRLLDCVGSPRNGSSAAVLGPGNTTPTTRMGELQLDRERGGAGFVAGP